MEKTKAENTDSLFENWMNSTTHFWEDMAKAQKQMMPFLNMADNSWADSMKNSNQFSGDGNKMFQAFFSAFTQPETLATMLKGMDNLPDFLSIMGKQAWAGSGELHKEWLKQAAAMGQKVPEYPFKDIDLGVFKTVQNIYEKEFQRFLNIPPLGLTRFYQERANRVLDKYNLFQNSFNEFLYVFCTPFEKANATMRKNMGKMAEEGEFYDDFKVYYDAWIKALEGHYAELLKSKEYTMVMDKAIGALIEYKKAKEELISDVLKCLPIPTHKEMDELYKDVYRLKKKVRELSKKIDTLTSDE